MEVIKILKRHEIDDELWDDCVANSAYPLAYALTWYLDIVCEKWEGIVSIQNSTYVIVLPVPTQKKWGREFVRMPLFCHRLGAFHSNDVTVPDSFYEIMLSNWKYINPYSFHSNNELEIENNAVEFRNRSHLEIDLSEDYEQLSNRFKKDKKKNLNKAFKKRLSITKSHDFSHFMAMFKEAIAVEGGIASNSYQILTKIIEKSCSLGIGEIYYSKYPDGKFGAAQFVIRFQNRVMLHSCATYLDCKKDYGAVLILDELMRENASKKLYLDFECGTAPESIRYFNKGFGAKEIPYQEMKYENLAKLTSLLRKVRYGLLNKG